MFVCEKDMQCVDCPKNYPDEVCDHWIEVEPVLHAYWIDCCGPIDDFLANCSNCGYQMDTHEERGYHKFCPNCGAKMDGEINHG